MAKDKEGLEKRYHHRFAGVFHHHGRKQHHMIRRRFLGIDKSATERIRLEEHIRVGKQQPVPRGLQGGAPHGVRLAQPALRQSVDVDHFQSPLCIRLRGNPVHDFAGAVGRTVVNRDHLVIPVVQRQ